MLDEHNVSSRKDIDTREGFLIWDASKAAWNHQQHKISLMNVQIAHYDDKLRKCKKQVKFLTVAVLLLVMVFVGVTL